MTDAALSTLNTVGPWIIGLVSGLGPHVVAYINRRRDSNDAKAKLAAEAAEARRQFKADARKDAAGILQGELQRTRKANGKQASEIKSLKAQNAGQQKQLDNLKALHKDCERAHTGLRKQLAALTGTVTKIKNGH